MLPGSHTVVITSEAPRDGIRARNQGYELRDSLVIFLPGQTLHALLLRIPLAEKTVATQVLATGTGALNIDGTRIGSEQVKIHGYRGNSFSQRYKAEGTQPTLDQYRVSTGRWPTNVLLIHGPNCEHKGTKRVSPGNGSGKVGRHTSAGAGATPNITNSERSDFGENTANYVADDGKETVANWDCQPNCPVKMLDAQSGDRPTGAGGLTKQNDNSATYTGPASSADRHTVGYADSGGASRFYPQFENLSQAASWLHRLIT